MAQSTVWYISNICQDAASPGFWVIVKQCIKEFKGILGTIKSNSFYVKEQKSNNGEGMPELSYKILNLSVQR